MAERMKPDVARESTSHMLRMERHARCRSLTWSLAQHGGRAMAAAASRPFMLGVVRRAGVLSGACTTQPSNHPIDPDLHLVSASLRGVPTGQAAAAHGTAAAHGISEAQGDVR